MALDLIHSVEMGLSVQEGTYSQPYPYDLNGEHNVLVYCYLNQVNSPGGFGGFGAAQVFITEYVQKGKTVSGNFQVINQNNVSHVTFTLTVSDANVQAVGVIFDRGA